MRGMASSIFAISQGVSFIYEAEKRLKAKVVVDETYGSPCFIATSFPQNATESETTTSGRSSAIFAVVISSRARVEDTSSSVANTLSFPTRSAFSLSSISKS